MISDDPDGNGKGNGDDNADTCDTCGGSGHLDDVNDDSNDDTPGYEPEPCPDCGGEGTK
jgi:DnaJ-class molecular chaperone